MKCPHCGKHISQELAAQAMGSVSSAVKASSSAANGVNWERPHLRKVKHFLSLDLFGTPLLDNEYKFKVCLANNTTYNPDYFHPDTKFYIEIATSKSNISEQRHKWAEAMALIPLRIFWWDGQEITAKIKAMKQEDIETGYQPSNGKLGGRPKNPQN